MKTKVTFIAIAIAVTGLIAWKLGANRRAIERNAEQSLIVNTVIPVTVEKPRYASIDRRFSVNGQIAPGNEVTVLSRTTAAVLKKHRKAGDAVNKGTVIAQLENGVIRENLRIAETDLARAQKDVERFRRLSASGAVTARELEETQIALRGVESRVSELKDQLTNTTVVSPVTGIIDRDYFEEGTFLTAGSPVADIVDDKSLKMKVSVTEKEILRLRKGGKALIAADVYPGKTFPGTVEVIAPKGNDTYSYAVELKPDNDSHSLLRSGMYATASFNTNESDEKALVVSRKAIAGGMKAPYVFVVRDSRAYRVSVQLGQVDNDSAEITQGISAGDVVVVSGQVNLRDGSEVTIIRQESSIF
ncbi:MAG: efflux RND transporter periplasmic adaptor subunit [Tannerella sp.]|jgi:RND family efflux transporter MFP subunit|nr:efflux RND transporter periplasmic adaptor subunit [Tannerella sp.]